MKALVGATLIDGTGGPALRDSVVLLDGDRIQAVGSRRRSGHPTGTQRSSTCPG